LASLHGTHSNIQSSQRESLQYSQISAHDLIGVISMNSSFPFAVVIVCPPLLFEVSAVFPEGGRAWADSQGWKTKTPQKGGAESLYLLRLSHIVPVTGLALAPWRLDQVAGRS